MTDDLRGLEPLADVPPPRRTDAAFARSVADGLVQRRSRTLFVLPALAAATAALALVVVVHPGAVGAVDAGTPVTIASAAPATAATVADLDDEEDSPFAMPSLDGSSDEELARLDHALDEALRRTP